MLFTDPLFLFYFLPAVLLGLRCIAWKNRFARPAKGFVVIATLVFYAHQNWRWVFVFLAVCVSAYVGGWALATARQDWARRVWLGVTIACCVLVLSLFKYLNWMATIWPVLQPVKALLIPAFGPKDDIVLPPGISFYVFEAISYCFDIYRRKIPAPAKPLDFLCFIAMFPRFIAGPIVRYVQLEKDIHNWAGMHVSQGLALFATGFAMKCLLADQFAVFVPYAFGVARPDFLQAWIGVAAYSFQLYFDFWAYSIMATGIGLCLGFRFPDNFHSPYHATSISDFWRRWHISLSSWLRDYLYIPLGGNRVSRWRCHANLLVTMLLGGLWHGANFTFAIWGLYHGTILVIERVVGEDRLSQLPKPIRHSVTLLLIATGWSLFKSNDLMQATSVMQGMLGLHGFAGQFNSMLVEKNTFAAGLAVSGVVFCVRGEKWLVRDCRLADIEFEPATQVLLWLLLVVSLLVAASSSSIPFLYFQF
jgi:alginate O-acetyltransferase complex protein AlgI